MLSKSGDPLAPRITAREAFLQVFGQITFRRIDDNPITGWAETHMDWASNYCGMGEICYDESIFTDSGLAKFQKWGAQNVAHELGHALDQLGGRRARANLNAAQIGYVNSNTGQVVQVAGGGWAGGYSRIGDGFRPWPWQQNTAATPGEEFADMFLGWSFNGFAPNQAGAARYSWMSANMPRWIALAVAGNSQ